VQSQKQKTLSSSLKNSLRKVTEEKKSFPKNEFSPDPFKGALV
jgi:hypothetical protein